MIIAGQDRKLTSELYDRSGVPYDLGVDTVRALILLEHPGNADDGKFWDVGGSWQVVGSTTFPAASAVGSTTFTGQAGVEFTLPAAATTGRTGAIIHYLFREDVGESTGKVRSEHIVTALPAIAADVTVNVYESEAG